MQKFVKTKLLLALAGLAIAATPAHAQSYVAGANGNMFLGFYESGVSTDLLVYIGNYTDYTTGGVAYTGSQETLYGSSGLFGSNTALATDLTSVFGANWASNVKWGVVGSYDVLGANTVFITDPTATSSASSSNFLPDTASGQGGVAQKISAGIDINYGGEAAGGATAANAKEQPTSNIDSYFNSTAAGGNPNFGEYNSDFNKVGSGGLYLLELQSTDASGNANLTPLSADGSDTVLGQFNLSSNGTVTYAAVPEPSTYAMMGIGALLLVLAIRRRRAFSTI